MIPERLEAKVERVPFSGCWIWTGATYSNGYGHYKRANSRQAVTAHRGFYELLRGPIPPGMDIDHLCRVRCCVNPSHLEPVTRRENLRRGGVLTQLAQHAAKRGEAQTCKKGHAMTAENTYVYPDGRHRACRICQRAGWHRWARKRGA